MAASSADPVEPRGTLSGDRVSSGDCWFDSESESSTRSYIDVARTPPATPAPPAPPALARAVVAAPRQPAASRLGPRSEVHHAPGGVQVDADGFQQPRRWNRRRRPRARMARPPPRSPGAAAHPRRRLPGSASAAWTLATACATAPTRSDAVAACCQAMTRAPAPPSVGRPHGKLAPPLSAARTRLRERAPPRHRRRILPRLR